MMDELIGLFNQGKLTEAIEQANKAVGKNPADLSLRLLLVQLVCFTGNWERVEKIAKQLKALDHDQEHLALTGLIDHLSIGELQRQAVWLDGMVPDFVESPDEVTNQLLWAWNCFRTGETKQYQEALENVLEQTPLLSVQLEGNSHNGVRDLDDLTCTIFEAFTVQGNYLWLPQHLVKTVQVSRPTRPIDHLWHKTRVTLHSGTSLVLFFPGLYFCPSDTELSDSLRLGRKTIWEETSVGDVGRGRRVFGAGDEEFTLLDFQDVTFEVVS